MKRKIPNTFSLSIGLMLSCLTVPLSSWGWADDQGMPSFDALEFSVQSLRDSAAQLKNKNQEILNKNNGLKEEILYLRDELILSDDKLNSNGVKDKKAAAPKNRTMERFLLHQKLARLTQTLRGLSTEYNSIDQKVEQKAKISDDVQKQIIALQEEISKFQKRTSALDDQQKAPDTVFVKTRLLKEREERDLIIKELENSYIKITRNQSESLKLLDSLKEQQRSLKSQIDFLNQAWSNAAEQERKDQEELTHIEQEREPKLSQIKQGIAQLKTRKEELEKILLEAKNKLTNKLDLKFYNPDENHLLENLGVLKKENSELKEQLTSLERSLQEGDSEK